ncbi:WxL domain-containing protein [Enterococcus sp. LJL90]
MTLNVYTKAGSDLLNGASLYGDGGPATVAGSTNSRVENIVMNIDAPDSSIGNLYASQYRNVNNYNYLQKNVDINVLRAGSIGALSGGNAADSINNTISYNSGTISRYVDVKLGTELPENPLTGYAVKPADVTDEAQKDISFGTSSNSTGLVNFTSLAVQNGFTALAGYGSIKNGVNATANLHYNQYDKFGDVTIEDGSGIGVTSSSAFISSGDLTVTGEGNIYPPAGNGKINLSSVAMTNDTDRLTWHMQSGGSGTVASTGSYFGSANAYQVLTFTSTEADGTTPRTGVASDITPLNFVGSDDATGKTFVGDNDLVTNASSTASSHREFGIMIPGSVIDYDVSPDNNPDPAGTPAVLSAGTGLISHDVTEAVLASDIAPTGDIRAIATVAAGVEASTGRLIIPILNSAAIYPTLTFNPDDPTGSWLRLGTIDSTKVAEPLYDETIDEQLTSDSVTWTMGANTGTDANEYSYAIDIVFSNQLELTGRNVIVTETQAATLTDEAAVQSIQSIFGRPFLTTTLSQADLDALQAGLAEDTYSMTIPVGYHIQDHESNPVNEDSGTWNIVVVPDSAVIADELDFAIYAHDGQMTLAEAQAVTDRSEIDAVTNPFTILASDGLETEATMDPQYITDVSSVTGPADVPVSYTATYTGEFTERTLTKPVTVRVMGYLYLSQVTDVFDFGNQEVTGTTQTYWPTRRVYDASETPADPEWTAPGSTDIVVTDTRGDNLTWDLSVKEITPLTDTTSNRTLSEMIYYQNSATTTPEAITATGISILTASNGLSGTADYTENYDVTSDWTNGEKGIQLTLPSDAQRTGSYSGTLEWTLTYTP